MMWFDDQSRMELVYEIGEHRIMVDFYWCREEGSGSLLEPLESSFVQVSFDSSRLGRNWTFI